MNGRAGVKSQPVRLLSSLLGELVSLGWAGLGMPTLEINGRKAGGIKICVCLRHPWGEKQAPSLSRKASIPGSGRTYSSKLQVYF